MTESDWKKFTKLKQQALNIYCQQVLDKAHELTLNKAITAHDRYLQLYQHIDKADSKLASIFDGHSRSNAPAQLMFIRAHNLADATLLAELSESFLTASDPEHYRQWHGLGSK